VRARRGPRDARTESQERMTESRAIETARPGSRGTSWNSPGGARPASRGALAVIAAVLAMLVSGPLALARPVPVDTRRAEVVVRAADGMGDAARASVALAGGAIGASIDAIGGFVADVPDRAVDAISHLPGIESVTRNRTIHLWSRRAQGDALVGSNSLA